MGLIKAAMGAADGVMADQWKEFLYCDSLDKDTLAAKGQKRTSSRGRSSNTSGEDNIITKGSVIVVNEGQCMMIVEQGKVVEICAEPGEYIYDSSTEPTVFGGDLASDLKAVFRNELSEELSEDWGKKRGIEIVSFGVSSVKAEEEDERRIKEIQDSAIMSNPDMRAGRLATATADAMRTAAGNEAGMGGAFGFMGMGMAGQVGAGAMGAFGQGAPSQGNPLTPPMQQAPASQQAAPPQAQAVWTCSCGHAGNAGKFCEECGKPQPKPASDGWTCSCGTVNKGKFCMECGAKKPEGEPLYRCDKCGWEPKDPKHPPKFCPECGDPFDESDKQ